MSHPLGTLRRMWADLVAWFQSPGGARILQTAIVPALAIVVAGVIAALIGRGVVRAAMRQGDRDRAAAAVAGLLEAARATSEAEDSRGDRRRAARLRTEADVRLRLLPMNGADLAATWAGARIDALGDAATGLDDLRDRLVAWALRPARAKRLFPTAENRAAVPSADASQPDASRSDAAGADAQRSVAARSEDAPTGLEDRATDPRDASGRPKKGAGGPRRGRSGRTAGSGASEATDRPDAKPGSAAESAVATSTAQAVPEPPAARSSTTSVAVVTSAAPSPVAAAGSPAAGSPAGASVPAWQRTRSGGRLHQERGGRQEAAAPDEQDAPRTAPVQLQHAHRAAGATAADADDVARTEAHLQARHARGEDAAEGPAIPADGPDAPAARPDRPTQNDRVAEPGWLDDYDDEAQVTQNLDLTTPPPVSATAVRDRGPRGEDLVPRS